MISRRFMPKKNNTHVVYVVEERPSWTNQRYLVGKFKSEAPAREMFGKNPNYMLWTEAVSEREYDLALD